MNNSYLQCSPSCPYRSKYESTQASLANLNVSHQKTLNRVIFLRTAIIHLLEKHFPTQTQAAQVDSGIRLVDGNDEFIVSSLQVMLTRALNTRHEASSTENLRKALALKGIAVPNGDNLDSWAEAIMSSPSPSPIDSLFSSDFDQEASRTQEQEDTVWDELFMDIAPPQPSPVPSSPPTVRAEPKAIPGLESLINTTPKRKKTITKPDPIHNTVESGQEVEQGLTQQMRDALNATIEMPGPVFSSDLLPITNSHSILNQWKAEQRGSKATASFIRSKKAYKNFGDLVIPKEAKKDSTSVLAKSTWGACIRQEYRGAWLYEVGVLLHSIKESDIFSRHISNNIFVIEENLPSRGLIGLIALPKTPEEGTPVYSEFVAMLGKMLQEKLELIAILALNSQEEATLEAILPKIIYNQNWQPTIKIGLGTIRSFAENGGKSLSLVL